MLGRIYAFLYDLIFAPLEWAGLHRLRSETVAPAEGEVLEVGVGTGLNLPLYTRARSVAAIDPDPAMIERAEWRRKQSPVPVSLVQTRVENLPFANETFDEVVVTLAFCSVADPLRGFLELRRVLKPCGRLRLLEHVRSADTIVATTQDIVTPGWKRVFGGCHPNRETLVTLKEAGFDVRQVQKHLGDILLQIDASSSCA
ncbi:MAG: class I SAM-dependent methyltransferase [Chloroflexi bacterium]|nr:class I SAM-dependent methyltransferase [Chloroflexota bacterium]